MKLCAVSLLLILGWVATAGAGMRPQRAADSPATAVAPTLVRLDGQLNTPTGAPRLGAVTMVVSLYAQRDDVTPLWVESQAVTLDAAGRYTLFAGATLPDGVPREFLAGTTPGRWLGVGVQGEPEQFRMMLVTVPYALKAREADTLTGKSASDFVLNENLGDTVKTALKASGVGVAGAGAAGPGTLSTAGALAKDDGGGATIFSTNAFEVGGNVGIGTPTPGSLLHVKGAGYPTVNVESTTANGGVLQLTSSTNNWQAYNQAGDLRFSNTSAPAGDRVAFTSSGNVGIGTMTPGALLDVNRSQTGPTAISIRNPTAGTVNYARLDLKTDGAGGRGLFDAYSSTFTTIGNSVQSGVSFTAIGSGGLSIALADASAAMRFYTGAAPNEQMRITSSGLVGIGTATPTRKLDVAGDINMAGTLRQGDDTVLATAGTNTGLGRLALPASAGANNTAIGYHALFANTEGEGNTAVGAVALRWNTVGVGNTATGYQALLYNNGGANTATGHQALLSNTTGSFNTASGYQALFANTEGENNTAIGYLALFKNTTGSLNTGIGRAALWANTTGRDNTAIGMGALGDTTGSGNTAVGEGALNGNTTGHSNIALGVGAGWRATTGNFNLFLGADGTAGDTNTIRIGRAYNGADVSPSGQNHTFIAGIRGITTDLADAVPVVIDSNGQLGTINSSRRFKEDIESMGEASRGLLALRPVTFRYQKPFADGSKPLQYGLIAEEVAGVYPDLVARSADGQIETVKYQVLDAMLLNEVQRQQRELQALEQRNRALEDQNLELEQRLTALEAAVAGREVESRQH